MKPTQRRRLGIAVLWLMFCLIVGWIFRPRYNEPEPPPRLDTQLETTTSSGH